MTESTSSLSQRTALVVDDNFHNRQIVRLALRSEGFSVTDYEDPEKAVDLLNTSTFSLLILDLQMPIMDGREVLRRVRANPLHRSMITIILTANAHMDTPEVESLADYVMYKPIDILAFTAFTRRIQPTSNPSPASPSSTYQTDRKNNPSLECKCPPGT